MKHKIVIKVPMTCDKCRSKALKVAAMTKGVSSMAIEGDDRDKVVVTGIEVDSVCLAKALRKKFGQANILAVEEVKDKDKEKEKEKKKEEEEIKALTYYWNRFPPYPHSLVLEYRSDDSCIIM